MPELQLLTELQLALLSILWERQEASTAEICEALKPERILAHTTVATLLSRLERRGVVSHRKNGRHYIYRPMVSQADVKRSMVSELTEALFGGDPAALVSHLVSDLEVDSEELDRIRVLIERSEASEGAPGQ